MLLRCAIEQEKGIVQLFLAVRQVLEGRGAFGATCARVVGVLVGGRYPGSLASCKAIVVELSISLRIFLLRETLRGPVIVRKCHCA